AAKTQNSLILQRIIPLQPSEFCWNIRHPFKHIAAALSFCPRFQDNLLYNFLRSGNNKFFAVYFNDMVGHGRNR
ncbi:MAG: hypothetical protein ACP5I8_08685, partial [Phycisphaerae bacterium]